MPGESGPSALQLKDKGNSCFKQNNFLEAVDYYSQAIKLCAEDQKVDEAVIYKNRAACYLKLTRPEQAVDDCSKSLELVPNDPKALYRRSQAYEMVGNLQDAYNDVKLAYQLEPKNTALQDFMRKLAVQLQSKVSKSQTTEGMIDEMAMVIENEETDTAKREQAVKNLVIYAHQPAGSDLMFSRKILQRLKTKLLGHNAKDTESFLKMMHGLCQSNFIRTVDMLSLMPLPEACKILSKFMKESEVPLNLLTMFTEALVSIVEFSKATNPLPASEAHKWPKREANMNAIQEHLQTIPQYCDLMKALLDLLVDPAVSAKTRDLVIDSLIKVLSMHKGVAGYVLKEGGIKRLVEVAGQSACIRCHTEATIPATANTADHISVAISRIADHFNYFEKEREKFGTECEAVIRALFLHPDENFNIQGLSALSAVFQACREVGQVIAQGEDVVVKFLDLAKSESDDIQSLAAEAMAYSAGSKQVCGLLKSRGLEVIRGLYQSKVNRIQVKGLVILCKIGMTGSGNVNDRFYDDDKTLKLYDGARKFLTNPKKDFEFRKWSVEGLSYLTMDAEIKERLVEDREALLSLIDLAKSNDSSVFYGVCSTLVNLTNSYDKPERNVELEQLAEFAKQPIPKQHEKDAEEYVLKRVRKLVEFGLVSALVNLSKAQSSQSKEMLSRIFHAIVEDQSLRGTVVQQGGTKCLIPLSLEGTEKGKDFAAQAIAKIGITTNPVLAFPGERCMEVVRPLINLLAVDKTGLQQFEAMMALTNLAQVNDNVRKRILKEKGFSVIEAMMFDEHPLLKRAATQCMCNMILCQDVFDKYLDTSCETERLKLLLLYSGEEDLDLAKAAAGALAILSTNADICERLIQFNPCIDILKELTVIDDTDLRHRGVYVVANMMEANKSIAEKLIAGDLFEIVMALSKLEDAKLGSIKEHAERALKAAEKWELIKPY